TDIEFFEEFPYHTAVVDSRAHRWTRGDWQLLPWILGLRREGPGRNLTSIGRWKMLDNLRRSLSAPGTFCTLVAAWAIPGAPQGWLVGFVLLALGMPVWMALGNSLVLPGNGTPLLTHLRLTARNLLMGLGHALVALTLLAHQAWLMVHAIGTTLGRLLLTRRHLLKWVTALQAKAASGQALGTLIRPLASATGVVLAAALVVLIGNPASLPSAAPLLLLWWLAPWASRALSRTSRTPACESLTPAETDQLRELGRRTWCFFTNFVTARDHYLPPDNFQEDPQPVIAHRSSPTNFGLYLLSVLAARDFGWLGLYDAVARLEATLGTLTRLPRLHGHFFNWYDTRDLHPLEPRYLSTVDSGNLAGHLLTLAQGCREAAKQPQPAAVAWAGLADTHRILIAALAATRERRTLIVTREELWDAAAALGARLAGPPLTGADWGRLSRDAETLADLARAYVAELADLEGDPSLDGAPRDWAERLRDDIASQARDRAAGLGETDTIPQALAQRLEALAGTAERLCEEMDFGFLYDPERQLFVLGYRVAEGLVDDSYYDLLASEARLTSLVAIAKRDVSSSHWFHLGRQMTRAARDTVLLSWSGSMFEYLMPSLVSFTPRYSLV
ncbi:MAG TPA: glycosyl transferase, partial [Chromatiaceae bacterium]|nr:glycosyl transferase [Chromatiaceae bacterium]